MIGDAVRDRAPLWAFCETCGHSAHVEPAVLADRLGYDFPVPQLRRRLRCGRCGGRSVDVRVRYPGPGVVSNHAEEQGEALKDLEDLAGE